MAHPDSPLRSVARHGRAARRFAALVAVGVAACDASAPRDASPAGSAIVAAAAGEDVFGGLTWRLVSQRGADGTMQEAEGRVALRFLDGRLTGTTGCNQLDASYALDARRAGRLTIETGSLTVRACADPLQAQEQLLLANLEQSASVRVSGSALVLRDAQGGELLVFEAESPLTLVGGSWRLVQVENGLGGLESVPDTIALTLTFGDDGSLTISTPCHDLRGTVDREAEALAIAGVRATASRDCSAESQRQETRLRAALGATVRYAIEEERLSLRTESGTVAARLVAAR
jgi:heat shock protein HslJ